jgi:hypothetical protein
MDGNLDTLEEEYVARLNSDSSPVTVSSTTSETALISSTTVPANSLQVGSVLAPWAYGTVTIPAFSTPSVTWRLRWGGIGGNVLASWTWNFGSSGSPYTLGWIADYRIIPNSVGASAVFEVDGWMSMGTTFVSGTTTGSVLFIDTTANKTLLWTAQPSLSTVSVTQRSMIVNRG